MSFQTQPQQQQQPQLAAAPPSNHAPDPSIYSRQVPGISNGELVGAIYNDNQKPHGQPNFNEAFTRTSPALFHHHNAVPGGHRLQQQLAPGAAANALSNTQMPPELSRAGTPIDFEDDSELSSRSASRRISALDASVREYHAKEIARHGQVLESLDAMQNAFNIRTWLLVAIGTVLLGLIILLLCMLSKHIAAQKEANELLDNSSARANFAGDST